jgi:hypothetical protein
MAATRALVRRGTGGINLLAPRTGAVGERSLLLSTSLAAASQTRLGVVRDGFKLVRSQHSGRAQPEDRLYRLPDESTDVSREQLDIARRLRSEMTRLLAGPRLEPEWRDQSPEQERALRALGYVAD